MAVYRWLIIATAFAVTIFAVSSSAYADQQKPGESGGLNNATLSGNAFQGANGVVQLNEAAGNGNSQGNIAVLQLGDNVVKLDDSALSQNVSSIPGSGRVHSSGGNTVGASSNAFAHSGGVVQINQVAGSSNHTINSFQLLLQTGP